MSAPRARRTLITTSAAGAALVSVAALLTPGDEVKARNQATSDVVVPVSEDTYVTTHDRHVAKGDEWRLRTGASPGERRALLKFTVPKLPPSTCGVSVSLRLLARTSTAESEITTVSTTDPEAWDEDTLWDERPDVGKPVATARGLQAGKWATFDVSSAVTKAGEISFAITHQGKTHVDFASRENTVLDQAPELVISAGADLTADTVTPACDGALWGLYRSGNADITAHESTQLTSSTVPRKFDAFRRYYSFSQLTGSSPNQTVSWPSKRDAELARDRVLFLQFDSGCFGTCPTSFNGVPLPKPATFTDPNVPTDFTGEWFHPKDVASGRFDPLLKAIAKRFKSFPGQLVVDISGEIDSQVEWMENGPFRKAWLAGYKQMWRHVHDLFVKEGVSNVSWNYVVGGFAKDDAIYTESYPGDEYVDWISWDPYDNGCAHGSAYATLNRFYSRLEAGLLGQGAREKNYGIMEFGFGKKCQEAYFKDMADDLKRLPKIRAVLYFDRPNMPYSLTTEGWQGYALAGLDSYLNQDD
ncbi:DUF7594 domain-containing protein [Sinosporangium album]|nr:DNRLRE domain-containing protein [Sinosporangium album]